MRKKFLAVFHMVHIVTASYSQKENWQNLDLHKDSVFGVSTEKAYYKLLQHRKGQKVIVAVIDSGIDTSHVDLKSVLWINSKEISGNGKDDDNNGYVDDVNGWNFIGSNNGNVQYDNLEVTRLIREQKNFFDSLADTKIPNNYRKQYQAYREMRKEFEEQCAQVAGSLERIGNIENVLARMVLKIGKKIPLLKDFQDYQASNLEEANVKALVVDQLVLQPDYDSFKKLIEETSRRYRIKKDYQLNESYDSRQIVNDDYNDNMQRYYGNNDIYGPNALHGTHVAGIIGAARNNNIGIKGVSNEVLIMGIRIVPEGDERDKDVANAIRYAVDNGARIINMSFGKPYSPHKKYIDEAIKYAIQQNVLLIHAAGNDGKNLDDPANHFYPDKYYDDGSGEATAWITVGASGWRNDSTLMASFSNYGKKTVDVFAPGVRVYSTIPESKYGYENGTSMAAPVVAGVAALIMSYYPKLSAVQVKDIIMRSVIRVHQEILHNINGKEEVVPFSELCVSGGIVNGFGALELASHYE